ncbi:jg23139 [Pararge aegeria aegeria]|uniref:Jg23139 protein n=1 Tax=Pararge aegeria aegeria TaxID=348720 RepID=A0A8S4SBV6_9NEOP|nr:jg23139 [Pararge aegeria aegeria]
MLKHIYYNEKRVAPELLTGFFSLDSAFRTDGRHPNHLIVSASFISPNLRATLNKRKPKHILHDPDDQITTDNAPYQAIQSTSAQSSPAKTRTPTSDVIRRWALTMALEACAFITFRNSFTPMDA